MTVRRLAKVFQTCRSVTNLRLLRSKPRVVALAAAAAVAAATAAAATGVAAAASGGARARRRASAFVLSGSAAAQPLADAHAPQQKPRRTTALKCRRSFVSIIGQSLAYPRAFCSR